jgi:hypothetical protein
VGDVKLVLTIDRRGDDRSEGVFGVASGEVVEAFHVYLSLLV